MMRLFAQLVAHVNVRGGYKGMQAAMRIVPDSLPGAVDVFGQGPAQGRHLTVLHGAGDIADGFEISNRNV